ncbi:uncharacterized protein LOC110919722 isoform X4 [Helianthus annuus]|uniref:uncharacterized protein LOC110919722 isoform X4 n=1 Tax=Helianthus annuus TaxID=4232 RepID=UPI0016533C6D|nr:uncharacterized protein LOC110919722 isoform X4 [Helianthus annuus]
MGLLETLHCHMEVMQRLPQKSRPLAKKNVRSICFFAKFRAISDQLYRSPHLSITNMSERRLLELELARARCAIQRAATVHYLSQLLQNGDVLSGDIYHNPNEFYQWKR